MANNRKVVIIGVLVAAAAVTVLAMSGVITPASNVQGTIGAAKRHQSEQIKAQDVSLTKVDIQRFLQSDLFRRIRSNPDLAKAMGSPDFAKAMENPDFAKAIGSPDFAKAIGNPDFAKAIGSPDFAKAIGSPDFAKAIGSPDFAKAMENPDFAKAIGE